MALEKDIHMVATLDSILAQVGEAVGPDLCPRCPAVKALTMVVETLRETNNIEIAMELGIREMRRMDCPCRQ
ncbi:MAG: hypothetical protein WCK39_01735 [Methanomassiliicoccales archaeon]